MKTELEVNKNILDMLGVSELDWVKSATINIRPREYPQVIIERILKNSDNGKPIISKFRLIEDDDTLEDNQKSELPLESP